MPSVCCRTSGNDVNRTLIPGRLSRAMHANATPLGVPGGNRTRVISSSIRFGCSKASMADIESWNPTASYPAARSAARAGLAKPGSSWT